jgi:CTP:phosphocholine cytidylyltransferase-like protein
MHATRHIAPARRTTPAEISVIIPCAGTPSKKMRSYGAKCLIDIDGISLIERQLNSIWQVFPRADIFVGIGFQAEKVRAALQSHPVRFIYNPIFDSTNVSFTINLALQAILSPNVLIIYGDLVFTDDVLVSVASGKSSLVFTREEKSEAVGIIQNDGLVTNLAFGLPDKWSQIMFLRERELDLFRLTCYDVNSSKWFGHEILNAIIDRGGNVEAKEIKPHKLCEVDIPDDIQTALKVK